MTETIITEIVKETGKPMIREKREWIEITDSQEEARHQLITQRSGLRTKETAKITVIDTLRNLVMIKKAMVILPIRRLVIFVMKELQ